jgi:hypothetical protein
MSTNFNLSDINWKKVGDTLRGVAKLIEEIQDDEGESE